MGQQIAGKAVRGDADILEACCDVLRLQAKGRLCDLVPEYGLGTGLKRKSADDLGGRPFAQ
jgi:hypothetical protein